jgi:transposase-like protein
MYQDRLAETDESKLMARRHVGELLGINPATLRNWIEDRHFSSRRVVEEPPADPAAELAALRKENAELRRANEILKTASAFFAAAEVDRRLR